MRTCHDCYAGAPVDSSATQEDDATIALEAPPPSDATPQELPERVGRFEVDGHIGVGGMGQVLSARDPKLDRPVAIKLHRYRGRTGETTAGRARMLHEARAMAQLQHPNVVTVFDVGEHEGAVFIAMEVVDGLELRQWLQARPRSVREIVDVFAAAARGLAAAHEAGIVHRDFKPANLMIDETGTAKVLDFGLAVETEEGRRTRRLSGSSSSFDGEDDSATGGGGQRLVYGTPKYMAPEQYFGAQLTEATDQYALCLALFEALTGEPPFAGDDFRALRDAKLEGIVQRSPKWMAVPRRLRGVVERGLAPEASRRWPSMGAFISALERTGRRTRWVASATVGAVGLVVAGSLLWPVDEVDRCEALAAAFAGHFDVSRRETLGAHADGLGAAPSRGWDRVQLRFEQFAQQWDRVHAQLCAPEATRTVAPLDCLHGQATSFDAALAVLEEGDAVVWQGADSIVDGLPRPSECLGAQADLELRPADPQLADAVDALRARLDRAKSRHGAGEWTQALGQVETLAEEADTLGYAPLRAEAHLQLGQVREQIGVEGAIESLETAYFLAHDLRYHRVELRAASLLAQVVSESDGDHDAANNWLRQAGAALEQAGDDPFARVALMVAQASVQADANERPASVQTLERALALYDEAGLDDVRLQTMLMNNIGHGWFRLGRYTEALALHRQTLEIRERELPGHPYVVSSLNNVGYALAATGDRAAALDYHVRALALARDIFGDEHPKIADTLNSIALCKFDADDLQGAIETAEESLRVAIATGGEQGGLAGQALANLGMLYREAGDDEAALSAYRRAREAIAAARGPNAPDIASVLNNEGRVLHAQGKTDEAIARWRKSIEIRQAANGPDDTKLAYPLVELGRVSLARGQAEQAVDYLRRALTLRLRGGVAGSDAAQTRFLLARALVAADADRAEATKLAREAHAGAQASAVDELVEAIEAWADEASISLDED